MNGTDFLRDERERILWASLTRSTWKYYAWIALLISVIAAGVAAYVHQLRQGLAVTGLRDQVCWGIYITNFVFFIGISHAGTLISSILRLCHAGWRQPVTRLAEAITVASLFIGGLMPVIDMGRPERMANMFRYGRMQSNLTWDIISVATYFSGSVLFLWLLMVPDIAFLRDHYPNAGRFRARLYRLLSFNWRGKAAQHGYLEKANGVMTIVILPLAVSVHTVVAWIFAMSLRPGWQSSIFGPYFVVGAIFSGIAASIVAMYVFRRVYRLEAYLKPIHFQNLGYLLLTLTLTYLYFNINEYLTYGYKMPEHERRLLEMLFTGEYAWLVWSVQICGVLLPFVVLALVLGVRVIRDRWVIHGTVIASSLVIIGAWAKRYLIVVPTLSSPFLPAQGLPPAWAHYRPTWVEWAITAAAVAGFLLVYTLISKLFPIVSLWETREADDMRRHTGTEEQAAEIHEHEGVRDPEWHQWRTFPLVLIACLVLATSVRTAKAAPSGQTHRHPTALALASARSQSGTQRVITVTAMLTNAAGTPMRNAPVRFEMKTHFGMLKLGPFPTNAEGKAVMIFRDKRFGVYPLQASFDGNATYRASEAQVEIDFGNRPPPSLPNEGVLIAPYPTFLVAFPFLLFYGSCWVAFVYALGWLAFWKMRKAE